MRISAKCSVAIHCLLLISEYGGRLKITSALAAESTGVNPAEIRALMNLMKKAGLIDVKRGVGGAYLMRSTEEITVWDIYQAVDPYGLEKIMGIHPNPSDTCPIGKRIERVLEPSYTKIEESVMLSMQQLRLSDFVETFREMRRKEREERRT
ncbi:MAG: Rrf2 family transcriptional regulator [Lachnospiraceae bacterium]|nr:Rrf2 family transcriptional regulator [Lachnospiraceae bacterium]